MHPVDVSCISDTMIKQWYSIVLDRAKHTTTSTVKISQVSTLNRLRLGHTRGECRIDKVLFYGGQDGSEKGSTVDENGNLSYTPPELYITKQISNQLNDK